MNEQNTISSLPSSYIERMELRLKANKLVGAADPESSRYWIMRYAEQELDVSYDWLMYAADKVQKDPDAWFLHPEDSGRFEGESLNPEFWKHYAAVRGQAPKHTDLRLSCSC